MPSNLLTQDRCVISFWKAGCGSTARSAEEMSNAHRKHWTIHRSCYSNFTMGIYQTPLLEMIYKSLWRLRPQPRPSDPFHHRICSSHILDSLHTARPTDIQRYTHFIGASCSPAQAFQANAQKKHCWVPAAMADEARFVRMAEATVRNQNMPQLSRRSPTYSVSIGTLTHAHSYTEK
ncbi:hypothetical protein BDP55DRAFT_625545 [Colletotrichum godetiae]|uniref:Uncharacterized protein n=1 Tax=Colletotrichum godetiae TaxID=1209918 RepID=A0AAJ0B0Q7_9PEZI|nr:uncharacterized protein BDP55DRAFT_625545 [Colletotrichum godetiae]KAK1701308.1 hypothetical protein BDP55DRAFT_625545 [Colletotrichum godetiae]